MRIKDQLYDDITVLVISGKMKVGVKNTDLHNHVKELIKNNQNKVVLDLGNVTWLASVGLCSILASYTSLKNAGGNLKLARSTRKIRSVLIFTHLIKILKDYDTVQSAVESF